MRFAALIPVLLLSGCAGAGGFATSDPLTKLNTAEHLLHDQGRPLFAKRLIHEAIAIYEERRDFHGLGHAYRDDAKARDTYVRALEAHRTAGRYDLLTNAYINVGLTYAQLRHFYLPTPTTDPIGQVAAGGCSPSTRHQATNTSLRKGLLNLPTRIEGAWRTLLREPEG